MQIGIGELYSVGAAASWGLAGVMYMRLGESMPPVALSLLKNLIVVGLMVPTVLIVHGLDLPEFEWLTFALAVLSGVLGISAISKRPKLHFVTGKFHNISFTIAMPRFTFL